MREKVKNKERITLSDNNKNLTDCTEKSDAELLYCSMLTHKEVLAKTTNHVYFVAQ